MFTMLVCVVLGFVYMLGNDLADKHTERQEKKYRDGE